MTNAQSLELFILEGEQAGARAPLRSGSSITIGSELDSDIVLRDPTFAGRQFRLDTGTMPAKFEVLAGEAELLGRQVGVGDNIDWPPYVYLRVGSTTLAYGEMYSPQWADVLQFGGDPSSDESAQLHLYAEPSIYSREKQTSPQTSNRSGIATWLVVAGIGLFGLTMGVSAFNGAQMAGATPPMLMQPDVATVLEKSEFSALEVEEPEAGKFTIHGYLETQEQRARLERLLAEARGVSRLQVSVGEQLATAVRDVYRVNGVAAEVQAQGPGIVLVKTAEANLGQLRRVETITMRDIAGLHKIVAENKSPRPPAKSKRTADDPGKRIASLVPGDPAYLVTTDGARYFVGAMLPTGHKISAISDQQVLLDKDGITTTLRF